MKWMIASDLHGSAFYCRQMIKAFQREGADRLLLLGDLLYHGPRNDLPEGYAPKEVIPLLNSLRPKLLCVRGNCDAEVDQMVLDFPILADYAVLPVGEKLIGRVVNALGQPVDGKQCGQRFFRRQAVVGVTACLRVHVIGLAQGHHTPPLAAVFQ